MPFLKNLKTHLIIRISKGETIDGKRETNRRGYEKMKIGYIRVSKQEQPDICAALGISRATLYRYVKKTEAPG